MFFKSISLIFSIIKKYLFFIDKHMNTIVDRFEKIKSENIFFKPDKPVNIIAVSKTFTLDHIKPLDRSWSSHFGENKVQEALAKWSNQKKIIKI